MFVVKWKHREALKTMHILEMLKAKQFTDCVLLSEGQSISAHKLILASGSTFFKKLFLSKEDKSTVKIDHVSFADLSDVVKFIYSGSLKVEFFKLNRFLKAAELLEVNGNHSLSIDIEPSFEVAEEVAVKEEQHPDESIIKNRTPIKSRKRRTNQSAYQKTSSNCKFCSYRNPNVRTMYNHQRYCIYNPNRTLSLCSFCKAEVKPGSMMFHKRTHHGYLPGARGRPAAQSSKVTSS